MPDASVIANEPQGHVASDVGDVAIRTLATTGDFRACVTLQREIWGREFEDIVPASLLHVATHVGGVAIGAFDAERLVGFVFGLAGGGSGGRGHWAHMLGGAEGARDRGIGRRLKEQQRLVLARRGIAKMYWTFDPLQARNAHLNLTRLGVHVVDYVADMYGPMGSPLHHGLATDRLIVMCHTVPALTDHARRAFPGLATLEGAPVLSAAPRAHDRRLESTGAEPPVALIEIP